MLKLTGLQLMENMFQTRYVRASKLKYTTHQQKYLSFISYINYERSI